MVATVSVAIPTHNRAQWLNGMISSILGQTRRDMEVLVSDNASSDNTPSIVSEISDVRLRYVRHKALLDPFDHLNFCLIHTSGEYVAIYHDDDWYHPRIVEASASALDQYPKAGMVYTQGVEFSEQVPPDFGLAYPRFIMVPRRGSDIIRFCVERFHNFCWAPSVMLRRRALDEVGLFDTRYRCAGDLEMWLRIARRRDVVMIQEQLVARRVHTSSSSATLGAPLCFLEMFEVLQGIVAASEDRDLAHVWRQSRVLAGHTLLRRGLELIKRGDAAGAYQFIDAARQLPVSTAARGVLAILTAGLAITRLYGRVTSTSRATVRA